MPGWSVVLKKETRSRRISSTEEEHGLNEEVCSNDLHAFMNMEQQRTGLGDNIGGVEAAVGQSTGRRRNWDDVQ